MSMFRVSHYEFMKLSQAAMCRLNESNSRVTHLFLGVQQVKQLHDGQEVSQSVLLNTSWDELQEHPHQVIPAFDQTPTGQLFTRGRNTETMKHSRSVFHMRVSEYVCVAPSQTVHSVWRIGQSSLCLHLSMKAKGGPLVILWFNVTINKACTGGHNNTWDQ